MSPASTEPRVGAVRSQEPRRKRRGLWWLLALLALLLLIALALVLYFTLRGDDPSDSAKQAAPSAEASSTPPAHPNSTPSAGTGPTATGATGGTNTAAGGLVGGSGVSATAASAIPGGSSLAAPGTLGTVLFAEDSATVDSIGQQVVANAIQQIRRAGLHRVNVTGYTDVVGGQPVNSTLSQQRADQVAARLRQQLGSAVTVTTAARGQQDPVVPNDTTSHRQLNRRATITTS